MADPQTGSRIGIDIGGTFTDVVYIRDKALYRGKSDTTHYDLKVGFMNATGAAAERAGVTLEDALREAGSIAYSTTVGTNALIERRGARLGLITTKGFEHTVHVGRARNWGDGLPTEKKYDRGRAVRPAPLIPQDRIVGIQERIDNLGNVIVPMRDEDVRRQVGVPRGPGRARIRGRAAQRLCQPGPREAHRRDRRGAVSRMLSRPHAGLPVAPDLARRQASTGAR